MKKKCDIQAVCFVKPFTLYDRYRFLKSHKLKAIKRVHETPNTFRYRIIEPELFRSFSTNKIKISVRDGESSGVVNLIVGFY